MRDNKKGKLKIVISGAINEEANCICRGISKRFLFFISQIAGNIFW